MGEDWFSVDLFGDDYPSIDERNWYDIAPLGFCDDGIKHWYEVELFSFPGASGYEEDDLPSFFSVDLVGQDYETYENRNWYDVDLFNEPISATEEETDADSVDEIDEESEEEEEPAEQGESIEEDSENEDNEGNLEEEQKEEETD